MTNSISDGFVLTLSSNSSESFFPDNTLQHYTTRLNEEINVPDHYQAALMEIHLPNSFASERIVLPGDGLDAVHLLPYVYEERGNETAVVAKTSYKLKCTMGRKVYRSMKELADRINNEIEEYRLQKAEKGDVMRVGKPENYTHLPALKYDNQHKIYSVHNDAQGRKHYIRLKLHKRMAARFGFTEDQFASIQVTGIEYQIHAKNPVMEIPLNSLDNLYVYSDLIKYQHLGDTKVPLLRICNVQGGAGEHTYYEFRRLYYFDLMRYSFRDVTIDIRTDTGEPVPFADYGRVVCVIHLRPNPSANL